MTGHTTLGTSSLISNAVNTNYTVTVYIDNTLSNAYDYLMKLNS